MSAHAQLSPSKRNRWALCPGSIREEAKYPEQSGGTAAIDGTHTHTLLEVCLKDGDVDASFHVGVEMEDHEGLFVVDKERAARVQVALDYIEKRVSDGNMTLLSESKVDPSFLLGRTDLSGTVDVQIIGNGVLELIDYKDGMAPVDAKGNMQLEQYAYGVLAGYKLPVNGDYYPA